MNDLIDRQQAIDRFNVIRPVDPKKDEYTKGIDVGIAMCIVAVKDQPSVQPEPQWIPVSERLPRDGSWNIFTDGKNISVERYKADAIDHFFPNGRWFQFEDVIAWMPLPEAYKPNK
jgi:hypothetical protein